VNAASKGYLNIVELLLNYNADPTIRNNYLDAAYDLAAQHEHSLICQILERSESLRPWNECKILFIEFFNNFAFF